jgi:putative acetyltransferase
MTHNLTICEANLDDPRVIDLLETHSRTAREQTAQGSAHALDLPAFHDPAISVWTAWADGLLVVTGALCRLSANDGEIKAMHTAAPARRAGVGRAMLDHIIAEARRANLSRLYLETGSWPYFEPARAMYAKAGFVECPPFGGYQPDPNSVFMTKKLAE